MKAITNLWAAMAELTAAMRRFTGLLNEASDLVEAEIAARPVPEMPAGDGSPKASARKR